MMAGPDTSELLELAEHTLREQVIPELSGDARYAAMMVVSAVAIAARETRDGGRSERLSLAALRTLLLEHFPNSPSVDLRLDGSRVEREVVRQIRLGALDRPADRARLLALLAAGNLSALRMVNPDLARDHEQSRPPPEGRGQW